MNEAFRKIIQLIDKTGDKCIVINESGEPSCVVMSLKDYEKMSDKDARIKDLSEGELLQKINRDIASWRSAQEEDADMDWDMEDMRPKMAESSPTSDEKAPENEKKEDETYYFEPLD